MAIAFVHVPHPHIAKRKQTGPAKTTDENVGFNGKVALILTTRMAEVGPQQPF